MPMSATNKPTGFLFVQCGTVHDRAFKKKVRSHVTKQQHHQNGKAQTSQPRVKRNRVRGSETSTPTDPIVDETVEDIPPHPALPSIGMESALSRGTTAFRTFVLDDADLDITACLRALDLTADTTLSRWQYIVNFWSRDYGKTSSTGAVTMGASRFFGFTFGDPALLTAAILLTVRQLQSLPGNRITSRQQVTMLALEQILIRKINEAISEGSRGISDHMLVAVALCSTYELINGTVMGFTMHMQGLLKMITMRGGLSGVAASEPFIKDWLIWHDMKTSPRAGKSLFFKDLRDYPAV